MVGTRFEKKPGTRAPTTGEICPKCVCEMLKRSEASQKAPGGLKAFNSLS